MATIDELRKSKTSASIQVGEPIEPESVPKKGFIPTIHVGEPTHDTIPNNKVRLDDTKQNIQNASASISTVSGEEAVRQIEEAVEENNRKAKKKKAAISTGMRTERKPERVSAEFKELPPDPRENLGVDIRKSLEDDVFHEGGPFDEYVREKTKEMYEWVAEKNAEAEAKAAEEEAKKASEDTPEEMEDIFNEESDDFDTTIAPAVNGKIVDISRKEKPEIMNEMFRDEEIIRPVPVETASIDMEIDDEDFEEAEELVPEEEITPVEPVPTVEEINHTAEIQNAEEIVSVEPIKEEKPVKKPSISSKINRVTRTYMAVEDTEASDDDDVEVESQDDEEEDVEALRSLVSKKIIPVAKKLDISTFTVAKQGTTSNNILETKEAAIAKWVLPATGIVILLREISGANLENIRTMLGRRPADVRGTLKIIFDHIVSPKPDSFEVWLKSIAFADYDHLFMAIYIAAFAEANYLPIDCNNDTCGKPYLTDDIQIMDMVKFKDEASEAKFTELYNAEPVNPKGLYTTAISPISERFAIAFKEPDLYSVLIESQYFSDSDNRKYQQTISTMPYIDNIYFIDMATRQLIPVEYKVTVNNGSKTAHAKLKRYDQILNTFSVDENAIISAYTQKINERVDWFSYRIPETTCPNCGHVNPAVEDQTAASLVFLRNRLGVLATI